MAEHPMQNKNLILRSFLVLALLGTPWGLFAQKNTGRNAANGEAVFNGPIRKLQITIPEEGLEVLRKFDWGRGKRERTDVEATVKEGEHVWTNVALHLKGSAGSFRPVDSNPALTLNFDKRVKGQKFYGLDKIHLNNSVQDPTLVSEQFCREIFNAAGIPTTRACNVRVTLNGKDLGVYVLVEGYNRSFLRRHFENTKGNLYDGGFVRDIDTNLETQSGENPKDQSDLKALMDAARQSNPTNRWQTLEKVLDVNNFATFLAMENVLWHWDGYSMNRNNYRIYHNRDTGKLMFLPHGLDQMFWNPTGPAFHEMRGTVAEKFMQTREGRQLYWGKLGNIVSNVFTTQAITNRLQAMSKKLETAPGLKDKNRSQYQERIADFQEKALTRQNFLQEQLSAPSRVLKFDSNGAALISGWKSKTDFGNPVFDSLDDSGVTKAMHIVAQKSSVGSYRSKVLLESGNYRLEGRARTKAVKADPGDNRGGAGLRLSNKRLNQKLLGDKEWSPVSFDFEVTDPFMEVEIVAELRAANGEVFFDPESLKILRK